MLQKPPHQTVSLNVVAQPLHSSAQRTRSAHEQRHFDARLTGLVKLADHAGVGQVVALEHHPSIAALQSFLDFAVDHLTEPPPRAVRRHNQMSVDTTLVVVLKELEQPLHLRGYPPVRRKERKVTENPRGRFIEIACPHMRIMPQYPPFLAGNQHEFGVCFEAGNAKNDLNPNFLKFTGGLDVIALMP